MKKICVRCMYFLLLTACSTTVIARENYPLPVPSSKSSAFVDYYGFVNAVYPKESRIVISDMSLLYNNGSLIRNRGGSVISDIVSVLKPGTAVKYHVISKPPYLILRDLIVVSERELSHSLSIRR